MNVALVTDSTAYLPAELASAHDIGVVPLHVIIGGVEHSEGIDVTPDEVAEALRAFTPVSTSRPAPRAMLDAYERAAEAGAEAIVSVHLSAEMSSTIGSATLAAAESPIPVTVVDSTALGMVMGYAVVSAARAAAAGASAQDVARVAREVAESSRCFFYVDTLEYLRRGGRIGAASALFGSALAIKPILTLRDGAIEPLERVRTTSKALARLEALAVEAAADESMAGPVRLAVQHVDSLARAQALAESLAGALELSDPVAVVELGAVVGAHVGPGTLAVVVSPAGAS